jgi:hypothetical protein
MRLLNRVLSVFLFVLIMAVSLMGVVAGITPGTVAGWLREWAFGLDSLVAATRLFLVLIATLLILSTASLIGSALRVGRGDPAVRLPTVAGGEGTVSTSSISQRLQHNMGELAHVLRVTPRIRSRGQVVDVDLDVETTPDVDVPAKTDEIMRVTHETLETGMGLTHARRPMHRLV